MIDQTTVPTVPQPPLILVTGPARSGKSEWAEYLAHQSPPVDRSSSPAPQPTVFYVATAQIDPADPEWQARILQHQQRRPASWQTWHVPIDLAQVLETAPPPDCWLIDSLGTWLANLLDQSEATWQHTLDQLLHQLHRRQSQVIIVAEETGWGVVPAYPIGRVFRDRLGQATRQIGRIADAVYLVTGGHVLNLSQIGQPLPEF